MATAPEPQRILLVDDEAIFLQATAKLLRQAGFACDTASSAAEALTRLAETSYDVLISDIKMPGNTQLEFIQELPQIIHNLPVILITGYPSLETAIESIHLSVSAYLVKPFEFADLVTEVQTALQRTELQRTFQRTRKRMEEFGAEIDQLESQLNTPLAHDISLPTDAFVALTVYNIRRSLTDLETLTHALATRDTRSHACHVFNCPRYIVLIRALRETIDVLEQTKHAFKSKQLGNLRQKLERLLQTL